MADFLQSPTTPLSEKSTPKINKILNRVQLLTLYERILEKVSILILIIEAHPPSLSLFPVGFSFNGNLVQDNYLHSEDDAR
jgi:hypothetical protein